MIIVTTSRQPYASMSWPVQNGVFTDLGVLPGYSNQPYAVGYASNNRGMIVGDSKNGAFIYENRTMSLLKRLSARFASDVNDSGDVVGLLETVRPGSPHTDEGFLFSDNSLIESNQPIAEEVPTGEF